MTGGGLPPGTRVGRYEIIEGLGAGGMARVYLARLHAADGFATPVVLKVMHPDLATDTRYVDMFRWEAHIGARLQHPNITRVLELGREDERWFLVMEHVDGADLSKVLHGAALLARVVPPEIAVYVLAEAARGVAYAHERFDPDTGSPLKIVHRDISPDNVLISGFGEVKISDFGVARASDRESLTKTGAVKGKPGYMSPEEVLGNEIDARVDVWALGVVLHEALTRRRLYESTNMLQLYMRITGEPTAPPSALGAKVDATLDAIVLGALEKSPDRRTPTAHLFAEQLSAWLSEHGHHDGRERLAEWVASTCGWTPRGKVRATPTGWGGVPIVESEQLTRVQPEAPRQVLPALNTRLIGRAAEIKEVRRLLGRDRLVTILGPAGMGKTRLARAVAEASAGHVPIWFCDVSAADDAAALCDVVAEAIGVALGMASRASAAIAQIGDALKGYGECLLVLDNFEQLVVDARDTVATWLAAAAGLRVLVTSRARLSVTGEVRYDLRPLPEEEAIRLFVDRACFVRPEFTLTEANSDAIRALVATLEGMPLAIELAAGRMRTMSLAELGSRLGSRLDLLAGPPGSGRHSSVRAAIDWSWELLSDAERAALTDCAAFRGGFSLADAEAVIDLPSDSPLVVDVVEALVDRSLLRVYPTDDPGGGLRLGMYESIREYAAERLAASGRQAAAWRRHAIAVTTALETRVKAAAAPRAPALIATLARERENVLAAHERAMAFADSDPEQAKLALRAALVLAPLYLVRGPMAAAVELVDAVLDCDTASSLPDRLWAEGIATRARGLYVNGRSAESAEVARVALEISRKVGDDRLTAFVRNALGNALAALGQSEEAQQHYEAGLAMAVASDDRWRQAALRLNLGVNAIHSGDFERARSQMSTALDLFTALSDAEGRGWALGALGVMFADLGESEAAATHIAEAIEAHGVYGAHYMRADRLGSLGQVRLEQGRIDEAKEALTAALQAARVSGVRVIEATCTGYLGVARHLAGDLAGAATLYDEAHALFEASDEHAREALFAAYAALAAKERGRDRDAKRRARQARHVASKVDGRRLQTAVAVLDAAVRGKPTTADPSPWLEARLAAAVAKRLAIRVGTP